MTAPAPRGDVRLQRAVGFACGWFAVGVVLCSMAAVACRSVDVAAATLLALLPGAALGRLRAVWADDGSTRLGPGAALAVALYLLTGLAAGACLYWLVLGGRAR